MEKIMVQIAVSEYNKDSYVATFDDFKWLIPKEICSKVVLLNDFETNIQKDIPIAQIDEWVKITNFGAADVDEKHFSLNKPYKLAKNLCLKNGFVASRDNSSSINNGYEYAFMLGMKFEKCEDINI